MHDIDRATHEMQQLELKQTENGREYEQILTRIRHELTLRFTSPTDPRLVQRRHRLRALFASIPQRQATQLHARLSQRRSSDDLSRLFQRRLATATQIEMLRILRGRFPATAEPRQPQYPGRESSNLWPWEPLPAEALDRYRSALTVLKRKVMTSTDESKWRYLCLLYKLDTGADDRVIEWGRICPRTTGAIGAAAMVGFCGASLRPVDQAELQAAIRYQRDVEPANRRLKFMTHLRTRILFQHEVGSESAILAGFRRSHDDIDLALQNLAKWANSPSGYSSGMPQAYRSIAGWIQGQRNDPRSVYHCF